MSKITKWLTTYILKFGISLDQFVNSTFLNGDEDEMISSRIYRERWKLAELVVNWLFYAFQKDHCRKAFEYEEKRRNIPFGERS